MLTQFIVFGILGWVVEAAGNEAPRYSRYAFGLPFLPVWGVGGVALGAISEAVAQRSALARAGAYAITVASVELAACLFDRALGGRSWNYQEDGQFGLCVDTKHTIAFTALAIVAEPWLRR